MAKIAIFVSIYITCLRRWLFFFLTCHCLQFVVLIHTLPVFFIATVSWSGWFSIVTVWYCYLTRTGISSIFIFIFLLSCRRESYFKILLHCYGIHLVLLLHFCRYAIVSCLINLFRFVKNAT